MKIVKSILAVLAGIVFIIVTHTVTDLVLESLGIFPPSSEVLHVQWMVVTAFAYRTILSIVGCFLTACLAPSNPMLHALIIVFIGLAISTAAAIVLIPMNLGPAWYPIALAVSSVPCAWFGGWIESRRRERQAVMP